jgi:hypothetical protein
LGWRVKLERYPNHKNVQKVSRFKCHVPGILGCVFGLQAVVLLLIAAPVLLLMII